MDKPSSPASAMSSPTALSTDDEAIVAAFTTVLEAEMARGRLEADGIGARVVDGNTVGVAAHLSMAIGGVKLAVARADYEAARAILFTPSALAGDTPPDAAPTHDEPEAAPPAPASAHGFTTDELANRALRASVVGLAFFPPLGHIWSLYLLARHVLPRGEELSPKGKRQATWAVILDALALGAAGFVASKIWF